MKQPITTYKYNFHATLKEFNLNTPKISSPLLATWKRSDQTVSSSLVDMVGGKVNFNQKITLSLNMYFQEGKRQFQPKKTLMSFTMQTPNGQKQAGIIYIEVSEMLNKQLLTFSQTYLLEKCPVKESKINIQIDAQMVGQVNSDSISVPSTITNNNIPQSNQFQQAPSSLSIYSTKHIKQQKPIKRQTYNQSKELQQKNRYIMLLQDTIKTLSRQKQEMKGELQGRKGSIEGGQSGKLRGQLIKSKQIQQKLQVQIGNLKGQNIQHQRQLQKMRLRMQNIYELLFNNLNNLY